MKYLISLALGATAAAIGSPAAADILRYTEDCERALALSAGPAHMREEAGVYILGETGFELDRPGSNGYMCMVVREGEGGIAPQCFDRAGQVSHVPIYLDEAKKRIAGVSLEQIKADRTDGLASGAYRPAPGPGVVYMASAYNFVFNSRGDRLRVAPHVMYHAPYLANKDIAATDAAFENAGMPFLNGEGPLGFMIGFTEKTTDSSDAEAACKSQLPDPADWRPFPARD